MTAVRMTKQRAQALYEAAGRGIDEWEAEIDDGNGTHAENAALRRRIELARGAMSALYRRYIAPEKFGLRR